MLMQKIACGQDNRRSIGSGYSLFAETMLLTRRPVFAQWLRGACF